MKKMENQNGKILWKHYKEIRNSFHLKLRNHKKLMNYLRKIQIIQQLFQNRLKIKKLNKNKN
jgi:hypothetical protein